MKQQVARLSPHQNAKVMAALSAIVSLIFFLPFALLGSLFGAPHAFGSLWFFIFMPIGYFVITYIMFVIGCALYNVLVPVLGGFEYESGTPAG